MVKSGAMHMRKTFTGLLAAALFASASSAALAQGLGWRVSETAGPVTVRSAGQARPAARGAALQPGDTLEAGPGGRAVLVSQRDFVTVSANSRITVPSAEKATGFVKILQDWGAAVFRIDRKSVV